MKELYSVFGEPGDLEGIDPITNYVGRLTTKCTYFCYANDADDAIRIIKNAIEFGILPYGNILKATRALNSRFDLYGNNSISAVPHLSYYLGSYEVGVNNRNYKKIIYAPGPWNKGQIFTDKVDPSTLN